MSGTIRSRRLDLVELSQEALRGIAARDRSAVAAELALDVPDAWLDIVPARENFSQLRDDPAAGPWLSRGIVLRADRRLVGEIGFHHPPDELAVVELGYEVLPEYRRRGIASEAVRALTDWAYSTGETGTVYVTIARANTASIGLVRSLGFRFEEGYHDAVDGPLVFYEAPLPLPDLRQNGGHAAAEPAGPADAGTSGEDDPGLR